MIRTIVLLALLLAACTSATEVYTPDGRKGLSISCGGDFNDWSGCFQKAGEVCREAGYDVFSRSQETGQYAMITYRPGSSLQGFSATETNRELLIACKGK